MSQHVERGQAPGFDPEAEQEVDFSRYARMLALRWWLPAAGLVIGAVLGYAVSIGGAHRYTAASTLYLGQAYSASGNIALATLQTNPSSVLAIITAPSVTHAAAHACKATPGEVSNITEQSVASAFVKATQNAIVKVSVESKRPRVAACVADRLGEAVVTKISPYAKQKIQNLESEIASDRQSIDAIKTGVTSPDVSTTDKLLLQVNLRTYQQDMLAASQLLLQANEVENPRVLAAAASQPVTVRGRRNTILVSALIGLLLGAVVALLWEPIARRVARNDGE